MLCARAMATTNVAAPGEDEPNPRGTPRPARDFTETRWLMIKSAAGQEGAAAAQPALDYLCRRYWPPIYAFLRRSGHSATDAEDLTQGFFAELLSTNALSRADQSKGRFRNFLLGALNRFLADYQRHRDAEKRGRSKVLLAGDFGEVERKYLAEADPSLTAEEIFDRRWSATVLEMARKDLEADFKRLGREKQFAILQEFLETEGTDQAYRAAAGQLGSSVEAIVPAVSRFRARYRECIRRIVMATVSDPDDVDPEFKRLFGGRS